jgi:hypothetical protein
MQALAFGSGQLFVLDPGTQVGLVCVSSGKAPAPEAPVRGPGSNATVTAAPGIFALKFAVVLPVMLFRF